VGDDGFGAILKPLGESRDVGRLDWLVKL